MKYNQTGEFTHDINKLLKKFSTLVEDLEVVKKNAIELFHIYKINNGSVFEIQRAGNTKELQFYKIKKFACKSLKGKGVRSGLRVIYAYSPSQQKIIFLEIYFKAKQVNEKHSRIKMYLKNNTN